MAAASILLLCHIVFLLNPRSIHDFVGEVGQLGPSMHQLG